MRGAILARRREEGGSERGRPAGGRGYGASLRQVRGSWRLLSVALLSFASGFPLGLVWIAVPAWMARVGIDIKVIGLFTLAQAPWSFKLLWSPAMDRYPPPVPRAQARLHAREPARARRASRWPSPPSRTARRPGVGDRRAVR